MSLVSTLKFILNHPLNKDDEFRAFKRFVSWQLTTRLNPYSVVYPMTEKSRMIVKKGMTGSTGNLYCGLHDYNDMLFLLHFLRPGDLFADIGANVGSYTVLASGHCGADTIALEPVPSTFSHLLDNIHINRIETRVRALNMALGSTHGTISFTNCSLDTINHVATRDDTNTIEVPVNRLDAILENRIPVLMKIDVEGYETEVLAGAGAVLENSALNAIIIELNGSGAQYGYDERNIHAQLLKADFSAHTYEPSGRRLVKADSFGSLNTIYLRDPAFVSERLRSAEPVRILQKTI